MLSLLTKYLLLYKRVSIPHIGTFEIVQEPSQFSIADKLISPPVYQTRFLTHDVVPDHQFDFIFHSLKGDFEKLKQELFLFGLQLKSSLKNNPFRWNGFGTLRYNANEIVFDSQPMVMEALNKVPAEKVIRRNEAHAVLVGDAHTTTHHMAEVLKKRRLRKKYVLVLGWSLALLAALAIIYMLYKSGFQITSAGLQTKALSMNIYNGMFLSR